MEGKEGLTRIGGTVAGSEAPTDYHVTQRTESQNPVNGSGSVPAAASPIGLPPGLSAIPEKKKRGRPRKFRPDGSLAALSPKPISTVVPSPVIDFSSEKPVKLRPAGVVSKQQYKPEVDHSGESVACSVGGNFTPHMLTVNSGEDVTMKIISFSQQGPRAVCILSATGVISSVTLRQPDSSGGTLTYEGRFEILSLSGSFMLSESGGTKSRSGGMSVSLASPDGRVIGGGVAGLLIAAGPIQIKEVRPKSHFHVKCLDGLQEAVSMIVVGSFLTVVQQEQKPKKHKTEFVSTVTVPFSSAEKEDSYGGSTQVNRSSTPNNLPSSSYRGELWSSRNGKTETNATTQQ